MRPDQSIKEIGLSVYTVNALLCNGIQTVSDIHSVGIDNLIKYRRIGSRVANEVFSAIHGQSKKTVTLNDFAASVKKIAHADKKKPYSVMVSIKENNKEQKIEFQCYVDTYGMFRGGSAESCLSKLKEYVGIIEIPKVVL